MHCLTRRAMSCNDLIPACRRSQQAGASGLAIACRTLAREELRGQVGNLRQDVNNIANSFDKTKKKAALASRDAFNKSVCSCAASPFLCRSSLNVTTTWPTDHQRIQRMRIHCPGRTFIRTSFGGERRWTPWTSPFVRRTLTRPTLPTRR